jgi:hypothetical protein
MIIRDFNIIRVAIAPLKKDPPLFIYAYAVLTFPVAFQGLQSVTRGNSQIIQFNCGIKDYQLLARIPLNIVWKFA